VAERLPKLRAAVRGAAGSRGERPVEP
jgi:hypothetical protein